MGFWPVVKKVVKDSDVVLLVLDARMPEMSRNLEAERMINLHGKKMLFVFNKTDLVFSKEIRELKNKYRDGFFVSGLKNLGIGELRRELQILSKKKEDFFVGVVGYPNVGKSSVINALARGGRARIGTLAGTTRGIQWVRVSGFKILDSPGVIPFEDGSLKLGLIGAKNPEKMKVPEKPADLLIKRFISLNRVKELEKVYRVDLGGLDSYEVLLAIGKKRGFLMRGGEVDERKTAIQILRDWQKGKLRL